MIKSFGTFVAGTLLGFGLCLYFRKNELDRLKTKILEIFTNLGGMSAEGMVQVNIESYHQIYEIFYPSFYDKLIDQGLLNIDLGQEVFVNLYKETHNLLVTDQTDETFPYRTLISEQNPSSQRIAQSMLASHVYSCLSQSGFITVDPTIYTRYFEIFNSCYHSVDQTIQSIFAQHNFPLIEPNLGIQVGPCHSFQRKIEVVDPLIATNTLERKVAIMCDITLIRRIINTLSPYFS